MKSNRVLGQGFTEEEEKLHGGMPSAAMEREPDAWGNFKALRPPRRRTHSKSVADTRWALTRRMVDGEEDVKARLVAKSYQGPDPMDGSVDTCGRSSHLWPISLGTPKKRSI